MKEDEKPALEKETRRKRASATHRSAREKRRK